MSTKMFWTIFAFVVVIGFGVIGCLLFFHNNGNGAIEELVSEGEQSMEGNPVSDKKPASDDANASEETSTTEMVALAENEEEAKEIANLYGMTFLQFNYGVATYETTQDPIKLMDWGAKQGYPEISINGVSHLD